MTEVVLVDKNDKEIGLKEKIKAHSGKGILHRAFTILIFNNGGEVLIQKRSKDKMLWPLVWETSCSSHPGLGEDYITAGEKRLQEELGFTCKLKLVDKFQYQAPYKDGSASSPQVIGSENEICALLTGQYDGKVKPVPKEIAEHKWIDVSELREDIKKNPLDYTPWLKIAIEKTVENFIA